MGIYLGTMAPGLTWTNNGSDGGDLIAAVATQGVAHPTGYPTYLLLAQLFQLLPVGNLAYRMNLMSAIATVAASLLVYGLVIRCLSAFNKQGYWPAGLVSGFTMGLSPLIWSQAVITEVYGLQALFVALILYLSIGLFSPTSQKRLDSLRGGILGLAVGNHVTTILLVPIVLLPNIVHKQFSVEPNQSAKRVWWRSWQLDKRSLLRHVIFFGVGLLVYLILPLRAFSNPPVNWGNPITPERLWWLVSGQLYQDQLLHLNIWDVWSRIHALAGLLYQQFGIPGLILALIGLVVFFTPSRTYFITICTMVTFSVFAIGYGSLDSYVYLIPAFISFSIWIGLATGGLMDATHPYPLGFRWGIFLVLIIYLFGVSIYHWQQVDASHDLRAESFGKEVLATVPMNAIVFAKGDRAVFTMWYFHFALRERSDIIVIATDLMHFDWYQETLRSVYPSLFLPGPFPWPETVMQANPLAPVCYVEYVERAMIDCK